MSHNSKNIFSDTLKHNSLNPKPSASKVCQVVATVLDTRAKDQKATKMLTDFLSFANTDFVKSIADEVAQHGIKGSKNVLVYKDQRAKLMGTLKGTSIFFKTSNHALLAETTTTLKSLGQVFVDHHRLSFSGALDRFAIECIACCKKSDLDKYERAKVALRDNEALQGLQALNISDIVDEEDATTYVPWPYYLLFSEFGFWFLF